MEDYHIPVMQEEILNNLNCCPGKIIVDCTVGAGGHSFCILKQITPGGFLVGIDQDHVAMEIAGEKLEEFKNSMKLVKDNFSNISTILNRLSIKKVDGFIFDLGISSMQLNSRERGFSFRYDSGLDMRMNRDDILKASDIVNTKSLEELNFIIKDLGEERWSYRIAKKIIKYRETEPIKSTSQLINIIVSSIPGKYRHGRIHPATRTFQALRIAVNNELVNLEKGLKSAMDFLSPGGRICVISFHSLEDRIVKHYFRSLKKSKGGEGILEIITKRPLQPQEEEINKNPRARSAKLRVAEKGI